MIVYLDVSCLNRPFDHQAQTRIRLEAEAVTLILEMVDRGEARQVAGEIAQIEIDAILKAARRLRVAALLPDDADMMPLLPEIVERPRSLKRSASKQPTRFTLHQPKRSKPMFF